MVSISPIHSKAALLIDEDTKKRRYMVISDLHIGFESHIYTRGITFDEMIFFDEMIRELSDLIKSNKVQALILLGDLKSTVGSISRQEWQKIPRFFKLLSEITDIYFVPGNHDSNIRFLTPENINVMSTKGMVLDDTLLVHGHTMPTTARSYIKKIVMGHIHPVFLRHNSVINGQRVWIYLKIVKEAIFPGSQGTLDLIILPAYNRYLYAINERRYTKSISPIIDKAIKSNAVQQALVVSLDGSIVGGIETLLKII
ncbi:MAG TPA: metallophosphoesterase [Nitrososphaeraceae archaeon]|nr:metallophosphoesterase [Nitrososphaeraceae archaeon]